jgi:hypothetical protein
MGGAMLNNNLADNWAAADIFGARAKRENAERQRREQAEAHRREAIDEAEAAWLLKRIGEDGIIHDCEKALLAFIVENSPKVHPSLVPLFERAGLKA